jgi:hypothetical protein
MKLQLRLVLALVALAACDHGRRGNSSGNPDLAVSMTGDMGPPFNVDVCSVPPEGSGSDNAAVCTQSAPANSFTPSIKWSWTAPSTDPGKGSIVMPLVGNFTDDNGDGRIDLCDIPDVLITTGDGGIGSAGHIYMLAGDTGKLELTFDGEVDGSVTPAFGDLDGDGMPEIVANNVAGQLVAYDNKGHIKWTGPDVGAYKNVMSSYCHAIAIYDLTGDGSPEIIAAFEVFDNKGKRLFGIDESTYDGQFWCPANFAADLDGDGKLEVIFGNAAYHADGSVYWMLPGPPGQPQVANLDADPEPEIFIARQDGILVLENDGKVKLGPVLPIAEPVSPNCWSKPGAVHDFDGDGVADISASTCLKYGVYKLSGTNLTLDWSATVDDTSGLASTTAFDFLGRGVAQAVYGDQEMLYIFDGKTGMTQLQSPRASGTLIEYPVVADIDNDKSADIVVVSNQLGVGTYTHTVDVVQDAMHRWIPTRRIWNQHAYHVTNIREDGTVPVHMTPNWTQLNTFRTNAQINGSNAACNPPVL